MTRRGNVIPTAALAALLCACHGPPIMSRIQPRLPTRAEASAGAPRPPDVLRTPSWLDREGRPESLVTDAMLDHIERAVRLRLEARRRTEDPCTGAAERARSTGEDARVGLEERGSFPLPVMPLLRLLRQELAK